MHISLFISPFPRGVDRNRINVNFIQQNAEVELINILAFLCLLCVLNSAQARYEDRYDLNNLPWDLKPVQEL
uniref:Uncharacterized protein n=1 Tax=Ditylenchus dipsaci TaxID=166011 RepID=A0A915E9M0_9BILA